MAKVARVCETCGEEFEIPLSEAKRRQRKYCSRQCSARAQSESKSQNVTAKCDNCGELFRIRPSQLGHTRYCSLECFRSAGGKELSCDNCGKLFWAKNSDIQEGRRFCSKGCSQKASVKEVSLVCDYCRKSFKRVPAKIIEGNGVYCSRKCMGLAARGENHPQWKGGTSSLSFYRGPNWPHQRRLVYQRDHGVCQICHHRPKFGGRVNPVHHIKPYREFNGDYESANDLSNLITLCNSCHKLVENGKLSLPQ